MLARRTNSARLAGVLVYMKCCVFASAFTCSLFAANAQAGPVRIALLAEAQIPGDAIVLADLLPADVHGKIRALADSILLGKTPQSGTWRYLNGPLVEETIEHTGISAANFDIPGVIAVQRLDRPLGGEEILANMRRSLGRFSLSSGEELALLALREDDVVWDAALRVPLGDARLRVQEILVDLSAGRAQFRMTAQSQAHGVPFDVIGNLPRPELLSESLADAPDAAARLASQAASREHSLAS